ncbi:cytochrome P450 [Rhodofomes roseus]|uniref:Cytochrome P450 n=1 Tax=Rhodofomes roseus TaxID=34475 RepID=A0ABQ8K2R4_9APHY|nr:cytochrome P450 [Rhodofomes roseus]KAH9831002.1 cytochrome P450 [Rhodofomes roseus]
MIFLQLGCFFFAFVVYKLAYDRRGAPLPPGPRGLPVLGNALQVPTAFSWLKFTEWAKTYGDVIHVSALQCSFIILSSREAITDLLEKRGAIYSDRPIIPMAGELAGSAKHTPLMQYGDRHKEGRKLILGMINVRNAPMLHAIQEAKAAQLVSRLAQDPSNFSRHIRWLVASVVLQITHGLIIDSCDDPHLRTVQEGMDEFSRMTAPGAYLVDSLPFLMHIPEWIPGAGFKKEAREHEERDTKIMEELWNLVKEQVAQGTALPSFAAELIQKNPDPSSDEEDMYSRNAIAFFSAGSDTTVSVINSFLIIVAQHPEIQRRAQSEIDQVVGHARLPKLSDRKDLPYLNAVLKEAHRINPVGPLSLPHKVRQDDNYRGYRIPAGATVLGNTWAIMHDPALYPDPHKVHPERYLTPNEGGEKINPDPRDFAFGYGRRVCPGQMLAEGTFFIAAAAILSVFSVSDAVSLDGAEINYEGGGIISHPCPFRCNITPSRRRRGTSNCISLTCTQWLILSILRCI